MHYAVQTMTRVPDAHAAASYLQRQTQSSNKCAEAVAGKAYSCMTMRYYWTFTSNEFVVTEPVSGAPAAPFAPYTSKPACTPKR
jgi:hypothetical protein